MSIDKETLKQDNNDAEQLRRKIERGAILSEEEMSSMYKILLNKREELSGKITTIQDIDNLTDKRPEYKGNIAPDEESTVYILSTLRLPIPSSKYLEFKYNETDIIAAIERFKIIVKDQKTTDSERIKHLDALVKIAPYINVFRNIENTYILNGYGRAGKDTFAEYCDDALDATHSATIINSVGGIVRVAKLFKDIDMQNRSDSDRKFLFDLKRIVNEYCDYCIKYILEELVKADIFGYTHVFVDVREPKEIDRTINAINTVLAPHYNAKIEKFKDNLVAYENAKSFYTTRTMFIDRQYVLADSDDPFTETQKFNHYMRTTGTIPEEYNYDIHIDNNGTLDELRKTAARFILNEVRMGDSDFTHEIEN